MANTVGNFCQGKLDLNFMPSFDDFSLWEDVVHPFFLMISVYISSFGPLGAVLLLAFFFIVAPAKKEITGMQSETVRTITPQLPYAANAARQSERVNEILKRNSDEQKRRVEMMESGEDFEEDVVANGAAVDNAEDLNEERIMELNNMIQESRKAQLESAIGPAPETVSARTAEMVKQFIGYGALLLNPDVLFVPSGFFFLPT